MTNPRYISRTSNVHCPTCGSTESAVGVWESEEEYVNNDDPDHIGCLECNEMVTVDND